MENKLNGIDTYNKRNDDRIQNVLAAHKDRPYLKGYYNYISSMSRVSVYNYLNRVNAFIDTVEGKSVEEINLDDYLNYISSLRGMTASMQIVTYSALKKFSTYLYISDKASKDYMTAVRKPKAKESQETKQRRARGFLTEEEINIYLSNVEYGIASNGKVIRREKDKQRDKAIILILLNTGMRESAMYKLDINSINMGQRTITVTDKGDKVITYEMNGAVYNALKDYLRTRENTYRPQNNALFLSYHGERLSTCGITEIVKKYTVGIDKNITPHKLRATYGTQLYNKTHDIMFVKSCMNHESSATTELYIRGDVSQNKKKAASIMDNLISNVNYDDYDM